MSDVRPKGIPIDFAGTERHLLFTLNAIDEIESQFQISVIDALGQMYEPDTQNKAIKEILFILLEDEVKREKFFNPDSVLKSVSEQEIGWMVNTLNRNEITFKILRAYGLSMPEMEEEDPNQEGGQMRDSILPA